MTKNIMYKQVTDENCMVENDKGEMVPNYDITIIDFDEGDILKGRVVKIDKDEVLVDVGFKSEGVIPLYELSIRNGAKPDEVLSMEEEIEIMVLQKEDQDGRLILSKKRAEVEKSFDKIESIYRNDETVEGQVIEYVKGGLILDIGLRGFLPASLIDIKKTRDLSSYIGERYACKIIEVDRNRNNVVLSRKAIIEDERKEQRKEVLDSIEVGQIRTGAITSIADFGAFVDVDGIDGLVHISELSWNHVKHPSEVVKVGQEVNVEILDIDYEKQRLSLGLKQTQKDPWVDKIKTYKAGDVVQGKVTRIVKFGLFVQIQEDMEGLVHISELSMEPVKKPSDVAKIGDELIVKIIDIDFDKRRMAFSIKQVTNPETASEQPVKLEDLSEELTAEEEKIKEAKPEAVDIKIEENTPEREREKAIKEILKEMKDEANL
ncbi:MAG: 30S ribosomal protein S1 [Actinobacteria bacterium]|nr:30S ribosomal protein S1 [Actinomycetota bacterium]